MNTVACRGRWLHFGQHFRAVCILCVCYFSDVNETSWPTVSSLSSEQASRPASEPELYHQTDSSRGHCPDPEKLDVPFEIFFERGQMCLPCRLLSFNFRSILRVSTIQNWESVASSASTESRWRIWLSFGLFPQLRSSKSPALHLIPEKMHWQRLHFPACL